MSLTLLVALNVLLSGLALAVCARARGAQAALAEEVRLLRVQAGNVEGQLAVLSAEIGYIHKDSAEAVREEPPEPEIVQHANVSAVSRSAKVREWMAQLEFAAAQEREKANAE